MIRDVVVLAAKQDVIAAVLQVLGLPSLPRLGHGMAWLYAEQQHFKAS